MTKVNPSIIFKMREISGEHADAAEDKLYKATTPITLIDQYESGLFEVSIIHSGEKLYELVRFMDFVYCPCGDFEFSGTGCKHCPAVMPKLCRRCRVRKVDQRGKKCQGCEVDGARRALRPTTEKKPERIGSIPI